jgi:hypothetical protein
MTRDIDKSSIANATTELDEHEEIEVTKEMVEAGCHCSTDSLLLIWLKFGYLRKRSLHLSIAQCVQLASHFNNLEPNIIDTLCIDCMRILGKVSKITRPGGALGRMERPAAIFSGVTVPQTA